MAAEASTAPTGPQPIAKFIGTVKQVSLVWNLLWSPTCQNFQLSPNSTRAEKGRVTFHLAGGISRDR